MRYVILIALFIIPGYSFSQLHLSFSTGLAGFDMREMKGHQSELKIQFPIDVKIIESFPPYWFYNLSLTKELTKEVSVGGAIGFVSTGGRMHYRDYSGQIECNQFTTGIVLAGQTEVLLNPAGKLPIYFSGKAGAVFGHYNLDLIFELNNSQDSDNLKFNSINYFIEPGFMMSKHLFGIFSGNLNVGYNLNIIKGKLKLSSNNDLSLQDNSGNKVSLDWSGFRLSAGLSIAF
jgi:hypothetical protein